MILIITIIIIALNIIGMLSHLLKYVQATLNTLLHPGHGSDHHRLRHHQQCDHYPMMLLLLSEESSSVTIVYL